MDRTYLFTVTTPAGTPVNAPVVTALPLEDARISEIRIVIPSGHVGLTGIRLLQAQQQIWPWANSQYLVGNDRVVPVPFNADITITGLQAQSYNTGTFTHHHYIEIVVIDAALPGTVAQAGQSDPLIVPGPATATVDPLSPDALLSSLPPEIAAQIASGSATLAA